MLYVLFFLLFLTNLDTPLFAQLPWINTIKGSQREFLQGMDITEEGDVIVTGYSNSTDYDFSDLNLGNYDIFLNKYNQNGKLIWKFNYGGSNSDLARHVKVYKNCIYITGNTYSFDNIFNSRTQEGAYLIKLDSMGKLIWIYNFGNLKSETETFRVGRSIAFASNDDILITGGSFSKVSDSANKGEFDIFVARINQNGKLLWKKIIGGSSHEQGTDILSTSNNSIIVLGNSQSNDGDFFKQNNGKQDIVILRMDSSGNVIWNTSLGGSEYEVSYSICAALDDGYVITGTTSSNDLDFQGMNRGVDDLFTVKLDSKGRIVWKKTYGGSSYDGSYSIIRDLSLGYTMLGYTCSSKWDQPGIQDSCRMVIAKINQIGEVISYQLYSGFSGVVLKKYNHRLITAGLMYNGSFLGDTKGAEDSFVMSLDSNGKFIGMGDCSLIINHPKSKSGILSGSTGFSIKPNDSTARVQWQTKVSGLEWVNLIDNSTYLGTNSDSVIIQNITVNNHNQQFRAIVNNNLCKDTSQIASLTVLDTCIIKRTDTVKIAVSDTLIIKTKATGIQDNKYYTFLIYPNPASTYITVDCGDNSVLSSYSFTITNSLGQEKLVYKFTTRFQQIDISKIGGAGLYIISIRDGNNTVIETRKLLIQ